MLPGELVPEAPGYYIQVKNFVYMYKFLKPVAATDAKEVHFQRCRMTTGMKPDVSHLDTDKKFFVPKYVHWSNLLHEAYQSACKAIKDDGITVEVAINSYVVERITRNCSEASVPFLVTLIS